MLFAAYLGVESGFSGWHRTVQRHADWLGLELRLDARRIGDGRTFAFGFLRPASVRQDSILPPAPDGRAAISPHGADGYLLLSTHTGIQSERKGETQADLRRWLTDDASPAAIRIGVSLTTGEILAAVPPAHVERLYWGQIPGGRAFSTDLRLMARLCGRDLDERGVYGLFRYRSNLTPFTLFKAVQCVPGGHTLHIASAYGDPVVEPFFAPLAEPPGRADIDPETRLRDALDGVLSRMEGPVIGFFSGGVDSSLLAARMAALGRTDVTLVNSAFGTGDKAGQTARQIAARLGLRLEQVMWDAAEIPAALHRLGRDYTAPFGDPATIAGNVMAHAALSAVPSSRTATTGAGVGPVFGHGVRIYARWERAERVPMWARRAAGQAYPALGLWRHPSQAERAVGVLRRAGRESLLSAGVTANPLDGIAYAVGKDARRQVQAATAAYLAAVTEGPRIYWDRFCVARAMSNPGHDFPAIVFDPVAAQDAQVVNPYLEPPMMRLSFSLTREEKCPGGEPKGLLKRMLARHLPPELVYGTSGSFVTPLAAILADPAARDLRDEDVFAAANPLLEFAREPVLREIARRMESGRPVAATARRFLWLFVFASAWLRQAGLA
jgi:asparagine synthase (glutamine-hydrolysing)